MESKTHTIDELSQIVAQIARDTPEGERKILAIAGAPGSGKSTLVETLANTLSASYPGCSAVLPMDGFHFDDEVLVPRGWRDRKGAPHTFDVGGLKSVLMRLRNNEEEYVAVPRFDRSIEIARAGALIIDRSVRLILAEGNYLLLNEPPWNCLAPLFDNTVMIQTSEATLINRLKKRWIDYELDDAAIRKKLEENDLPNGRLVYRNSQQPDFILST